MPRMHAHLWTREFCFFFSNVMRVEIPDYGDDRIDGMEDFYADGGLNLW